MRITRTAGAFVAQCHALMHAETVLLVDDDKAETCEVHTFLEQGVRADDDVRIARFDSRQ